MRTPVPAPTNKASGGPVSGELFHGYALNAIDAKNRLSVPAAFRAVVERRSPVREIVLAPSERAPCLVAYDQSYSPKLQAQLESRFDGAFTDARDAFARQAFGLSEPVPYDDAGRIIMPAAMRELGEIERLTLFLAAGDYFELWNPTLFLEQPGLDRRMVRLVERLVAARGEG